MASIGTEPGGRRRILFVAADGRRMTVRLGKCSQRDAEQVCRHVEALADTSARGLAVPSDTSVWLAGIGSALRDRLVRAGLVGLDRTRLRLGELVDTYIARRRQTWTAGTFVRIEQSRKSLLGHFGADRTADSVGEADAEDYRAALLSAGLSEATTRKRCSDARSWFRYAMKAGYIRQNPFEAVPTSAVATNHRAYISEADARLVLAEIADPTVRLVFLLARWGGLRIASEPRALRWDCIDWARQRFTVESSKTKRHGKGRREVPLFAELAGPLQDAFTAAEDGEVYVLPKLHGITATALRKPMLTAIHRAGLKPWPRLWHSLRASRQTDLEQRFPTHVVCGWLGNSPTVAARHYLQIRESDYAEAVSGGAKTGAESAAQNPAQYAPETSRKTPQEPPVRPLAACCNLHATPTGSEPHAVTPDHTKDLRKTQTPRGTESGTLTARGPAPALDALADALRNLPADALAAVADLAARLAKLRE